MGINYMFVVFSPFLVYLPQMLALIHLVRRKQIDGGNTWTTGMFLLFLWSLIVGLINRQGYSFAAGFAFFGFYGVSLFLHHNYQTTEKIEKILYYIFSLTLISAVIGILEGLDVITPASSWWKCFFGLTTLIPNDDNLLRITGTFGNPNLAASWYGVMILVGFHFYEKSQGQKRHMLFFSLLLLIVVLVMTGSRGAFIGLLIGLTVYDLVKGRMFHFILRILILFVGLLIFLGYSEWFPRGDLLSLTIDLRWAIWENCFNMYLKKPITGWGIMGIYFADDNVYQYLRVLHAHNMLISLAVMLGSVGILIFIWMEGHLLAQLWELSQEKCPLAPLLAAVQALFWGHGIFDFTAMAPQIGLLFIAFSSFIGTLGRSQVSWPDLPRRRKFTGRQSALMRGSDHL
ncbi:MAG: O-antigen ligase family protein [Bacillota bacterium]